MISSFILRYHLTCLNLNISDVNPSRGDHPILRSITKNDQSMSFWLKIDHSWPLLFCASEAPELLRSSTYAAMSNRRSASAPGGGGGGQWGWSSPSGQGRQQAPPYPSRYEVVIPWFMEPITETADPEDQSIIVIDKRADRMVSPFQTWLVSEIMANAASSINVLT